MKILFLAPQPFYQERGTPIAVRLALEVISRRINTQITLLTYNEGESITIPGVDMQRIGLRSITNISPGISLKKIICDISFTLHVIKLLWQNRSQQFQIIHAVEESVFIAFLINIFTGIPYIYDMDSSLPLQISEKWRWSRPMMPIFNWLESLAIKYSRAVVPVCYALYQIAERAGSKTTLILHDISLLDMNKEDEGVLTNIRQELKLSDTAQIALYIGNLEKYQGIDLLLHAFQQVFEHIGTDDHIVVIGGQQAHIEYYTQQARILGVETRVHFMGPRPVSALKSLLLQADLLLSPRILGNNTPMKIYSYLHSGVPIVATRLPTHTQVLDDSVAFLAEGNEEKYGQALLQAFTAKDMRKSIGIAAQNLANEKYTFKIFERDLNSLYDRIS